MDEQFTKASLETAAKAVHAVIAPTPQIVWPLLSARIGAETWVKHENHTPIGAFKVRGGLFHLSKLRRERPDLAGVITATRGNHGQSIAYAARRVGLAATIVVPHANSVEKNAAMRAFGARLIEGGHDFQAAYEHAEAMAREQNLHFVDSFSFDLVRGVASYALELFAACDALDRVYVPIGLGSGICGVIAARDALGIKTEIVGVVAERAAAYALSFNAGRAIATNSADTFADGVACRMTHPLALPIILKGAARVVTVTEDEMKSAMRAYFTDTHNVVEGAGAASLAAALKEAARNAGRRIALVVSGGNIDRTLYVDILAGDQAAERMRA
ncbi:MAG TPA: threonine dehydratase [Alphaproteobacteria bacterium]|jgi:threonine dehydratase|nr:threonine dehydratase [Alphaproteobacteria bacterium]